MTNLLILFSICVSTLVIGSPFYPPVRDLYLTEIVPGKLPLERTMCDDEFNWRKDAIAKLWKERKNMGYTPLIRLDFPGYPNVDFYLKNETATPTRSLKHRFAWALLMWAIVEGKVNSTSTVYEVTSGNTGSGEAYMCRLVGLKYYAVVAPDVEEGKIKNIMSFGGKIIKEAGDRKERARQEAGKNGGFFINQFANSGKAEEYHESGAYGRESTNVFHEIVEQLKTNERGNKIPDYFIHCAGTGGTISSVGRYVTRYNLDTKVILSDSEYSRFYDYVAHRVTNTEGHTSEGPEVAGTGFGGSATIQYGNTTSLVKSVIYESMKMPDIATTAAMLVLRSHGLDGGASTALNVLVALAKARTLSPKKARGENNRITFSSLLADPGEFYENTYYNATWRHKAFSHEGGEVAVLCWVGVISRSIKTGSDFLEQGLTDCRPEIYSFKY